MQSTRVLGGRYHLLREIAQGGMATVWHAHDALLDREVAVKLLLQQFGTDPEFLERFRREARAAARLSHPNIVSIFDVGEDTDTHLPYIVMELVEGGNLKDRIRRTGTLPEDEIRGIGSALAATLAYAHERGIIHRDVKPQNILLDRDGRPRLTDFGIAQPLATSNGLTRTGSVMGSVHYLAPELVRGRSATPQTDVYGMGVVLYEMATGRVPFEAETDLAVALAHVEQTPAAPRALNAGISPDLERIILRSLSKDPESRFAGASDLANHLRSPSAATRPTNTGPVGVAPGAATQRMHVPSVPGPVPAAPSRTRTTVAAPPPRRATRPAPRRGASGGILWLMLALAIGLLALGAGFFGLATLSREGVASPPTVTSAPTVAATPTAPVKPAVVATHTTEPTPAPSATPVPVLPTETAAPTAPPTAAPTATIRAISVAQLRGKTLDQAQAALKADGLTVTVRGVNANVDKDVVIDQQPDVGSTLPPGGTVAIVVGSGSTAVPDVANAPRDQAVRALQSSSFKVVLRPRRDPRVPADVVIDTNPPANAVIPRGSQVELNVSAGR